MWHGAGHCKAAGDCGPCDRHDRSGAESPQDSARSFENARISSGDSRSEQKLGTCSVDIKVNSSQQISFNDSVFSLTAREKKALDNSWAKIFADEIFPNIDEERFSVLYSSKASRPNAPVNVIIGALIIKELFDYSDDKIVENLMLDLHLQYALHTTSFEEQPISDKTLSRFRSRCYNYETTHGIDLYHDCVKDLSSKIAKLMNLSGRIKRMDSMMIESNIRFLSRMELIYTCIF